MIVNDLGIQKKNKERKTLMISMPWHHKIKEKLIEYIKGVKMIIVSVKKDNYDDNILCMRNNMIKLLLTT